MRVRQAFTQAIDRQSLIDNILKGNQIPATSFAPPGIFGAPPPGEVGLGYNPEAAAADGLARQRIADDAGQLLAVSLGDAFARGADGGRACPDGGGSASERGRCLIDKRTVRTNDRIRPAVLSSAASPQ